MLRFKLLTAIILLAITEGNCQKVQDEKTEVHKTVIKQLKQEGEKFNIYPTTKKSSFRNFGFAYGGQDLDTISSKPSNQRDWILFIKSIDTSIIGDYALTSIKIGQKEKRNLIFAPVVFSKDGSKALCIATIYSKKSQTGSGIAWLLERKERVWSIVETQTFVYID